MDIQRDQDIKSLLQNAKTIAVVGAKDKPGQPVDNVGRYLMNAGYIVIPVHPKRRGVWGFDTYPDLTRVPVQVDIVDLFRASDYCPDHALEVLEMQHPPMAFWMQLGISSIQAAEILKDRPVQVIQDKCIKVEHQRLLGA